MSFTYEEEDEGRLAFLDVLITRSEGSFLTSVVYRKPTFSGLYSHYESFMPSFYKVGMICTLSHRVFILCSNWERLREEVCFLWQTFLKNAYPGHFIDKCVQCFLAKIFLAKRVVFTVPKRELKICLPFLGRQSLELKSRMQKCQQIFFSV